jgi:hypothetical protein
MAFMRDRRSQVLAAAIDQIADSSPAELPAVVHAALGNVGSYQLDAAYAVITDLSAVVRDPAAGPEQVESARSSAVAALRPLQEDTTS